MDGEIDDLAFWTLVRRALLMLVAAIERRWGLASKKKRDVDLAGGEDAIPE